MGRPSRKDKPVTPDYSEGIQIKTEDDDPRFNNAVARGLAILRTFQFDRKLLGNVEIAEATPMERTLDLNADVTLDMMKVYVQSAVSSPELKGQLEKLLATHKKLIDLTEEQESLRRRLDDYRERMDELHGQIVTLTAVKTGGDLMTHLKDKMKDISDRVQKATISMVDTEEKIMLTRVQFQDAIAELTLPDVTQTAAVMAK